MTSLSGKFRSYNEENMEEFYKAAGVGFIARKAAKSLTFELEFTPIMSHDHQIFVEKNHWSLSFYCIFKSYNLVFQLGVPFDFETSSGVKCQTTITLNGNTFTQISEIDNIQVEKVTRLIEDDHMTVTCESNGKTGYIYLKRLVNN